MKHHSLLLLVGALSSCYLGDFAGLPCASSSECGPLLCLDGVCADPVLTSAESDESSETSETSGSTGSTESSETSGTSGPEITDKCCEAMDILFVLDNSFSMENQCFEETLGATIYEISEDLYSGLTDNIASFHVGFTTAAVVPENPTECRQRGALMRGKPDMNCLKWTRGMPYLSEQITSRDNLLTAAVCLVSSGTVLPEPGDISSGVDPQNDARPIQAMLTALDPELSESGGCNDGFVRKDVPLLTIMFTNSDQPQEYIQEGGDQWRWWMTLMDARGLDLQEGRRRNALALIAGPDAAPDPHVFGVEPPMRIANFAAQYDATEHDFMRRFDICALRPDAVAPNVCGAADDRELFREFLRDLFSEELLCDLCRP